MEYNGNTRFKGNTVDGFSSYKETAEAYPRLLSEEERLGFKQKPFDWSAGHPNYMNNMYQILNGIQAMQLQPGATIVEVGSGAGWATEILASLKYRVICIEPSDVMVDAAKSRVSNFLNSHEMMELNRSVKYICNTLEEETLPTDSVDAVLFFESFHHIIDENVALDLIRDFLKPDGVLCILGDSNWIPGNKEQEMFWEDEMRRFGTLESPFTHDYLTALLEHHQFYSITRHHGVNAMIPFDQGNEPVRKFAGNLDAAYVNLFTAKNGKERKLNNLDLSISTENVESHKENLDVASDISNTNIIKEEINPNNGTIIKMGNWIKNNSPEIIGPTLSKVWHKFIKRHT